MKKHKYATGERHGRAVLTEKQIAEFRANCIPYSRTLGIQAFAEKFGVHMQTLQAVRRGRSWGHAKKRKKAAR
jgi:hypothetical protein